MTDSKVRYGLPTQQPKKTSDVALFSANIVKSDYAFVEKREVLDNEGFYRWGADNMYPTFIYELYRNTPFLNSAIDTLREYTLGESIDIAAPANIRPINSVGQTFIDVISEAVFDLWVQGGSAVEVARNDIGEIAEIASIDVSKIRSNLKRTKFWYKSNWKRRGSNEVVEERIYTKFIPDRSPEVVLNNTLPELLYFSNLGMREVYPRPYYESILPSAQNLLDIQKFYLANLKNQLGLKNIVVMPGLVGKSDEEMKAIQQKFERYLGGPDEAGRFLITGNALEVKQVYFDDFGNALQGLRKSSKEDIYQSLRVIPQLVGDMSASTGFNSQEFQQAFDLMNATVRSKQNIVVREFERIFGAGTMKINPLIMRHNAQPN